MEKHSSGVRKRRLHAGPADHDIAPATTTSRQALGAAMIGWYGTAMLCYATKEPRPAQPDDVKAGVIAYKIARTLQMWPKAILERRSG